MKIGERLIISSWQYVYEIDMSVISMIQLIIYLPDIASSFENIPIIIVDDIIHVKRTICK